MSIHPTTLVSRRTVLIGAAAAAGAAALTACGTSGDADGPTAGSTASAAGSAKGSAESPLPKPAGFTESPLLKAQVDAGSLAKVEDRLPENPYVVPHNWVQRGNYGGTLKMNITSTSADHAVAEWFYGYSPLRYLNDSRTIGPGIVEKWQSNADASEWTFTLRTGLKWSDGKPVTTADVLFWWNDMANDDDFQAESVPDECKSGKGTICTLVARDDQTWVMTYDAPAPLTADRLATWTNGYSGNGPSWIVPAHFVKQFHPKYNKSVPADWASVGGLWETHAAYRINPECPTLAGFRLTKYNDGRSLTWQRNPYYYAVTRDGDQLPYIDQIVMTEVADPQVGKIQIASGKVDISHAAFNQLSLADVSTLMKNREKAGIDVYLWDSGTGSAGAFFLNQDYYEAKYRQLFREPKFRQALSMAFDREEAKKAIYFQQGKPSTGTMSPKAAEFGNAEGEAVYAAWRDSFVTHDPAAAKALLDDLGLKDANDDGLREFPDGSKLHVQIALQANASDEFKAVTQQIVRDWKTVGIDGDVNPSPPASFDDTWNAGKYMGHSNRSGGDGPNCLVYPQWIVPIEDNLWAPLQGQMYGTRGTKAYTSEADVDPWKRHPPRVMPDEGGPVDQLWKLYDSTKIEPDLMKRNALVWEIVKVHTKYGPFFQGTVENPPQPVVVKNGLKNVPTHDNLFLGGFVSPWTHPSPAVYDPESFFWDVPEDHTL